MEIDKAKQRIIDYIFKSMNVVVTDETRLVLDLDLTGLDIDLFLKEFAEEFKTDFSSLNIRAYFMPESRFPFGYLVNKHILKIDKRKRTISLDELVDEVLSGRFSM